MSDLKLPLRLLEFSSAIAELNLWVLVGAHGRRPSAFSLDSEAGHPSFRVGALRRGETSSAIIKQSTVHVCAQAYMNGLDPYWERLRIAYELESERRYGIRTDEELNDYEFEPGEFAHAKGGVSGSFYDFMRLQGYSLTRLEEQESREVNRRLGSGKFCLVLRRIDEERYLICYLTTFNNTKQGEDIGTPAGRFFAIPIGKAPPYPPSVPALRTNPDWRKTAFVFGAPCVRHKSVISRITWLDAFNKVVLQAGELDRAMALIKARIELFNVDKTQRFIRKEQREYMLLARKVGGIEELEFVKADQEMMDTQGVSMSRQKSARPARTGLKEEAAPKESSKRDSPKRDNRPAREILAKPYRIHFLRTEANWDNIRWPLKHLYKDIVHTPSVWTRTAGAATSLLRRMIAR